MFPFDLCDWKDVQDQSWAATGQTSHELGYRQSKITPKIKQFSVCCFKKVL